MEDYFYTTLNENTVRAVRQNAAFFMGPNDSRIPPIVDSYSGQPITGVNYFNLKLANDINGRNHTEYVKMSEALSANREWFTSLPRESRPMGTLYREESAGKNIGYSFVMPTAELNQSIYRNYRNMENRAPERYYAPFQSSNASMNNFNEFVHEQFTNAINASLANCPFKNNIRPHEMEQFKAQLVSEISRNPAFMAMAVNRARDEALEFHHIPSFDRAKFIERARDESSPEFSRLNTAINAHVHDMYHNRKNSFNPEFGELSRPLVIKVDSIYQGNPNHKPAVDHEISSYVQKMIRQDGTAAILADTFAGTFIGKAIQLVRVGKRVIAGAILAGAIINNPHMLDHANNNTQSMNRGHSMRR